MTGKESKVPKVESPAPGQVGMRTSFCRTLQPAASAGALPGKEAGLAFLPGDRKPPRTPTGTRLAS